MAFQTWVTLVNAYQQSGNASGAVYENASAATDVSPGGLVAGQALAIPANFLVVGTVLRFTASGIFSNTGTPKIVLGLYYGGVAGTALAETAEITTPSGITNQTWALEATSRVIAVGTSGKILTLGNITGLEAISTGTASASTTMMPQTSSTGGEATIETGVAKILTLGATWKTAATANKFQVFQWLVEILN